MQLDHIQLACPPGGEERARQFFGDLLGMIEETKPEPLQARGGVWFRKDAVILHIGVEAEFKPQRKAHPAFLMGGLDALAALLAGEGYPDLWDESLREHRRFYSEDPFGNRIEFMQDGDGFSQR